MLNQEIKNKEMVQQAPGIENSSSIEGVREEKRKDIIQNLNGNENKYRDDGKPNFKKIPKQDARKAAEEYGEGCESLTDFLEACIKNDIITTASCAGHPERGRDSSVDFDISSERTKRLIEFIVENKLADSIYVRKLRLINNKVPDPDKIYDSKVRINQEERCILTVTVNMAKRDKLYKACTEEIKKIIKNEGINTEKSESPIRKIMTVAEQYEFEGRIGYPIGYNIQDEIIDVHPKLFQYFL